VADIHPILRVKGKAAITAYFIKVDEDDDLYAQDDFIWSNYAKGGQIYLLNAKPGRYAVVATGKAKKSPVSPIAPSEAKYITFFSEEIIKLTEVTVAPGSVVFIGDYVVEVSSGLKNADNAQLHYAQLIMPDAVAADELLYTVLSGDYYSAGSLYKVKHDKQVEIDFLTNALEHLKYTDWIEIIQRRFIELRGRN